MSYNIVEQKKFFDTGNPKRQKENFQGFLFDGFKQKQSDRPISFYRSDFRKVKIRKCHFVNNDFSRADFMDCMVEATLFEACTFRYSEFQNCFFSTSDFTTSKFSSASFNRLVFSNCTLEKVSFHDITARDCSLKNCKIIDTEFIQNSFDTIRFEQCNLINIDLSNMTGLNFYFVDCTFSNLTIETDYIGTYFFKGTYLHDAKLKYRGKIFKVDMQKKELLGNLFKIFWENHRYYEAINICIQQKSIEKENISLKQLTNFAINSIAHEKNVLSKEYQLEKIFQLYTFFFNDSLIPIDDYFYLIALLQQIDTTLFTLEEQILIKTEISKLETLFNYIDLSDSFIETKEAGIALLEITIDEKNEGLFLKTFDAYISRFLAGKRSIKDVYTVLSKRKGSIIYQIAINAVVGLFLLRTLKMGLKEIRGIINHGVYILVDIALNKKILTEAKNAKTLAKKTQVKEFEAKSIQAIEGRSGRGLRGQKRLSSMVKSAKYFPDAPLKVDH